MKFIHTSDWHLGKMLQGQSLLEDQEHMLRHLLEVVEREKPDAVILAGDVYDRSIPPAEAVKLLDDTLHRLVNDMNTPVLAVAGNHDSPGRLRFGSRLMQLAGYHMGADLEDAFSPVTLTDEYGQVQVFLLPYVDLATIRQFFPGESIDGFGDAYRLLLKKIQALREPSLRCVLVTHAFVTPGGEPAFNTSDAEKQLTVGGVEYVPAELFASFNYTAIGHLHRGHYVTNESVHYSGSPLKYSIKEEFHSKSFFLVELLPDGGVTVTAIPVTPLRDVRTVEGMLRDIENHKPCQDFVWVRLLDKTPATEAMERIRAVYPNALGLRWEALYQAIVAEANNEIMEFRQPLDIVEGFFETFTGKCLSQEDRETVTALLEEVLGEERGEEE